MDFPWVAFAILAATYVLLSAPRWGRFAVRRSAVALGGAALMVLAGPVTPARAWAAQEPHTLGLLLGMMVLAAGLEATGFYGWLAVRVARRARTQAHFLAWLMGVTAALSALLLNDAVVLLFVPVVLRACATMGIRHPARFLVALALAANLGSAATQVGNPQNAYVALRSGIPFLRFSAWLALPALAGLVAAFGLVRLLDRERFRRATPAPDAAALADLGRIERPRLLAVTGGAFAAALAGFALGPWLGVPLSAVALAAAAVVLVGGPLAARDVSPLRLLARVDWGVLGLFVGLFVLLDGAASSGLLDRLLGRFGDATGGAGGWLGLAVVAAVLSNVVSNVPAVLLLAPLAAGLGGDLPWVALAGASTLAGNATLVGAAANLIVAEAAAARGVPVRFLEFMRVGLPVTLVTLTLALALLAWEARYL